MKKPVLLIGAGLLVFAASIVFAIYQSAGTVTEKYLDLQNDSGHEIHNLYNRLTPTRIYGMPGIAFMGKGFGGMAFDGKLLIERDGYASVTSFPARLFIKAQTRKCFTELHESRVRQIELLQGLYSRETSSIAEIKAFLDTTTLTDALEMACVAIHTAKEDREHNNVLDAREAPAEEQPEAQQPETRAPTVSSTGAALALPTINRCGIPPGNPTYTSIKSEGLTFDYPSSIATVARKSGNGTVYQLSSPDDCLRINVYHYFNVSRSDAAGLQKQLEQAHSGVTYRFKKGDAYVVSGNEERWSYYVRGIVYGKDKASVSEVEILVPEHAVGQYGDIVSRISKSMTASGSLSAPEFMDNDGQASRNTALDFYRVYVNGSARQLEVDYQSDTSPAACQAGIAEERAEKQADLAYCTQAYGDDVEAREKKRWGL